MRFECHKLSMTTDHEALICPVWKYDFFHANPARKEKHFGYKVHLRFIKK